MPMKNKLLLVGFPKSGNTWIGYMLSYLLNAEYIEAYNLRFGQGHTKDERVLKLTSGNLDGRSHTGYSSVIKSHAYPAVKETFERFPRLTDKIVLLIRDPRDVAVSHYYYTKILTEHIRTGICTTKHISFHRIMVKWKNHTSKWIKEKPYILKYEDLHTKGHETLEALLSYLEVELDHNLIEDTFSQFTIDKLKKNTYTSRFFRKGIPGDHKNLFTRIDYLLYNLTCRKLAREFGYE
jgi:hypothetical protein